MAAVLRWSRLDLRRGWRSLLVLALLIALAAGTVMTAVAGARRGASAVDRLYADALPSTISVVPSREDFDWDVVRELPEVAALATFAWPSGYEIDGVPTLAPVPADAGWTQSIERPIVLDGRLPNHARPDEAVVTPAFAEFSGKGVGDAVTLRLYQPQTLQRFVTTDQSLPADGPTVQVRIVGIVRGPLLSDAPVIRSQNPGLLFPSAGLFGEHAANLVGASGSTFLAADVRLHRGAADVASFKANLSAATGFTDIEIWDQVETRRHAARLTGFEANVLFVFALAAGAAAVFLIGAAVARYAASTIADLRVLRAVGMDAAQTRWAATIGPSLAALTGAGLGAAAAVAASAWFPIGTASYVETSPGTHVDVTVLAAGVIGIPALVAMGTQVAAAFAIRATRLASAPRRSVVVAVAARLGLPVSVVAGLRLALEQGRGPQAVPVRPALVGAAAGVLGVLAAFTFESGISDARQNPARSGQTYQLQAWLGANDEDIVPVDDVLGRIAADPDVTAVNNSRVAVGEYAGVAASVYSFEPVRTPLDVVVLRGRLPRGPDEIAFAPFTVGAMGLDVGDTVELTGTRSTEALTVTGVAFVPEWPNNYNTTGGWLTGPGFDRVFSSFTFHTAQITVRPEADPETVQARIQAATASVAGPGGVPVEQPRPPSAAQELQQVRMLPVLLAGFLALLAIGVTGHALVTAVRRRRHDFAVVRALGMTRWQCRSIVLTHAIVVATVGLAVGVPLGVALGRIVWRYVADAVLVHYVPPVAGAALALVVPAVLLAAGLLAIWPSQRAASMRVGHVLRAE